MIQKYELIIEMYDLQSRIASLEAENARLKAEPRTSITLEWLNKIQPDFTQSASYEHGFHDAIQIIKDRLDEQSTEPVFTVEQISEPLATMFGAANARRFIKQTFNIDL